MFTSSGGTPSYEAFGVRLARAMKHYGSLCVGIDPHDELLDAWSLPRNVSGVAAFTEKCVEACAGRVGIVKPQIAFYERYGSAGYAIIEDALRALRERGTLVLLDVKRGDIGSTMRAYAHAWLDPDSPLYADAITVSPYLGVGSLDPAYELAAHTGSGLFVLARTSNPEGSLVQEPIVHHIISGVRERCVRYGVAGDNTNPASFGLVVGATVKNFSDLLITDASSSSSVNMPILMPGVGAQGAGIKEIRAAREALGMWCIPTLSRAILSAGPHVSALTQAIDRAVDEYTI